MSPAQGRLSNLNGVFSYLLPCRSNPGHEFACEFVSRLSTTRKRICDHVPHLKGADLGMYLL